MPTIEKLTALEILDSRGRPTVGIRCKLKEGASAWASVPSGASTGKAEAVELRDGDPSRYGGLGCRQAVANIHGPIQAHLHGVEFSHQRDLDAALTSLDGSPNKSRLGANAILAVSIAFARAYAVAEGIPLYQHFSHVLNSHMPLCGSDTVGSAPRTVLSHVGETVRNADPATFNRTDTVKYPARLPRLTVNLFSGGKHAGGQVPIQDVLVVPLAAKTIDESLATTYAVYQAAAKLCAKKYQVRTLVADEGGSGAAFCNV